MNHKFRFKPTNSIVWLLFTVYITFSTGCTYYRVKKLEPLSNQSIAKQLKKKSKYYIIHMGEKVYHFKDIAINSDNSAVKGFVEALPVNHSYYKTAKPSPKANRFKNPDNPQDKPIHEIHIYTTSVPGELNSEINIPFSTINKVDSYVMHGATTSVAVVISLAFLFAMAYGTAATAGVGF